MERDPPEHLPLVAGRDAELGQVTAFVESLAAGPAALLIEGEAGIGKSTLYRAATAAASSRGHRVITATAAEGETDLPFVGLRDLVEQLPSDAGQALPPQQRDALDVALLRTGAPGAVAEQHAVCVAVLGVVRAVAAQGPVLVAVDDVGWLDRSSERVLRYAVRRMTTEQVGVLVARRSAPDADVPLGLDRPPTGDAFIRVELGPLPADLLHGLLTEKYGLTLSRRTVRHIHHLCGGNPFMAAEIGRAVHRGGQRVLTEEALPLPGSVLAVTARRIGALGPDARRVLAVVATTSSPTVALVAASVGERAHDGLKEAVAEGLLDVAPPRDDGAGDGAAAVTFSHPLLRSAVAANLSSRERRALHRELASIVTDPDERAVHLAAGALGPDDSVAQALDGAARRAFARGAPDAGAALSARAAALSTPGSVGLARRTIRAAEYRYRAEDTEAARTELTAVLAELPAGEERAEALLWLAAVRQAQNAMTDAVALAREALAQPCSDRLRSAVQRGLAYALVLCGNAREGNRHATDALATAQATGHAAAVAESEIAVAWTRFWVGQGLDPAVQDPARVRHTRWTRYTPHGASPAAVPGLLLSWADRIEPARAALLAENHRLTELGQDRPRALVQFTLSELECRAGNWDEAERHAADGMRTAELGEAAFYSGLLHYARGLAEAHRGRLDAARADAEQAIAAGRHGGSAVAVRFASTLLGFVELSAGNHAAVHHHLGPLAASVPTEGGFDPGLMRFVPDEVEALVALGQLGPAQQLLAPFEAQAVALDRPWAMAAAGRCRALLAADAGDTDGALSVLDGALRAHDLVEMPFERARTLLVAGSVRLRARRRREARDTLTDALAEFTRLGAVTWAGLAQAELGRIGGRRPSPRELTEAERRIAELVAVGRTNREVAAELFLAVGTVETALSKIYRKLDVRSRTELAARISEPAGP